MLLDATFNASGSATLVIPFQINIAARWTMGSGPATASATGWVRLAQIYATEPDPNGDPEQGQNEFTMPDTSYLSTPPPSGEEYTHVPFILQCVMRTAGGDSGTLNWAKEIADWALSRDLPGPAERRENQVHPTNGDLYPTFWYPDGPFSGSVRAGLAWWEILPQENSVFGKRDVRHSLSGTVIDTSKIEVFFPSTGNRHPPGEPPGYTHDTVLGLHGPIPTPNWIYYYHQAWRNPRGYTIQYVNRPSSYTIPGDDHVHIGDDAHGPYSLRIYETRQGANQGFLVRVGAQPSYGIDTYANTVIHECTHKWIFDNFRGAPDADGDTLPDQLETQVGLDPNRRDTTGFGAEVPSYATFADNDVYCQLQERDVMGPRDQDWADDGLNHGTVPGPNPADRRPINYTWQPP